MFCKMSNELLKLLEHIRLFWQLISKYVEETIFSPDGLDFSKVKISSIQNSNNVPIIIIVKSVSFH